MAVSTVEGLLGGLSACMFAPEDGITIAYFCEILSGTLELTRFERFQWIILATACQKQFSVRYGTSTIVYDSTPRWESETPPSDLS